MEKKGFFGALFDLSFEQTVTPRVAKVVYVLTMIVTAIGLIGAVVQAASSSGTAALLLAVVGVITACLGLIWVRIVLELIMAVLRIAENTRRV